MDVFVATQPIFDRKLKVVAYELLYREEQGQQEYAFNKPDAASIRILGNLFQTQPRSRYTGDKTVFINFTDELILNEIALFYPKDELVVEILESVVPTPEIIKCCKELKQNGYTIALDDFVDDPSWAELIECADIIKIDFMQTPPGEIIALARKYGRQKRLLAEKIETQAEFKKAFALGFVLFQGYFFSKPEVVKRKEIEPIKEKYLRLLKLANKKHIDVKKIGNIISGDVALSLKLLRLVNSCAFPHRIKITNVHMALRYIGETALSRWVSLIAMADLSADKPSEIIRLSLIRAKLGEQLAAMLTPAMDGNDAFILGMFSLLDVAIGMDFDSILEDIAMSTDVKAALINGGGPYAGLLNFFSDYEHARWDEVKAFAEKYGLSRQNIMDASMSSMVWYNELMYDITDGPAN